MAIDISIEEPLSLTGATKAVPRVDGKRPDPSTIWRWMRVGIRGVKLEHIRIGHRVCTTRESLNRFFNALAATDADPQTVREKTPRPSPRVRTEEQREKDVARAERSLRQRGFQ